MTARSTTTSIIPLLQCSRCKNAWYHDQECQKRDYRRHKVTCRSQNHPPYKTIIIPSPSTSAANQQYTIEKRHRRGECMIAARHLTGGEKLLNIQGEPFFAPLVPPVLYHNQQRKRCAICFGKLASLDFFLPNRSDFHSFHFCGVECSNEGRLVFQEEDEIYAKMLSLREQLPGHVYPTVILVHRILRAIEKKELTWEYVLSLQSHSFEEKTLDSIKGHTFLILIMSSLSPEPKHFVDLETRIIDVFQRIPPNTFEVTDERDSVGFGLFHTVNKVNHSCEPNCTQNHVIGVPGNLPVVELTMNHGIPKGSEVTISYIDTDSSVAERQLNLKQHYSFDCRCSRCRNLT